MATTAPHSRDRRRPAQGAQPASYAPSRLTAELRAATLDGTATEPNRLRWVRLLAQAPFQYGSQVWQLDADRTDPKRLQFRWEDVKAALLAQPARFQPTVTFEHTRNGFGAGVAERIVCLTAAQAKAKGIPQAEPEALYAGLRLTDAGTAADYDAGRLQWVSPAVFAQRSTDQPGHTAPIWIDEISFVTVPHLRGQPNVAKHLREAQLTAGATMLAHEKILQRLADKLTEVGVDPEKAKAVLDDMTESMGMEEYMEAEDAAEKGAEKGAEMADAEMQAKCAALEGELASLRAERRVDRDLAGRTVTAPQRAALAKLAAGGDEATYGAMLSALGPAPANRPTLRANLPTSRPAAVGGTPEKAEIPMGAAFANLSAEQQDDAIEALCAAKGVDYVTGANWCTTGIQPRGMVGRLASGLSAFPTASN